MPDSDIDRREFIGSLTAGAAAMFGKTNADTPERPPNVVVLLTDDQGWGDLSVHGNTNIHTPNIDSLARDGVIFDRFYACPLCAPTRAELLTGRYHPRGGVRGVSTGEERLNLDERTIGDAFSDGGYATAAFGKWHNGTQYPYHPNGRGFDEFYGFCSGHWGHYFAPDLEHNGQPVKGEGYLPDDLTNHAISFIEESKDSPFFCYLPFNTPHSPWQVTDEFYEKFADASIKMRHRDPEKEEIGKTRCALAMCENIDWNVGRILTTLEQLDLADNTIVVYFSDNGPNTWRWNGGMKGRKGSTDEGGVRVPCLVRWPGRIETGTRTSQIAATVDLLPTLADMAGIEFEPAGPLDGVSLKPLLLGMGGDWPDRIIFSHNRGRTSVRTQRYRLDHEGALFDMVADPGQYHDVADDNPRVTARLSRALEQWQEQALPRGEDDRPFPVGYAELPRTFLPARDGVPSGEIERSSRHPNCSFFTNWISTDDRMTWDIEVATGGQYQAAAYYTCPADDVGSTVELSLGQSTTSARVEEAYDPPLVGADHDREPRTESYVKDFRQLDLGTLRLGKGRAELSLRALDMPGDQIADIRAISLTLIDEQE